MDKAGFTEYLKKRDWPNEKITEAVGIAEGFESFIERGDRTIDASETACETVIAFSKTMIEAGKNTWDNYVSLIQYGRFVGNDSILVAALELIDGAEVLGNLYDRLGEQVGEAVRDEVFEGIEIPPLGAPNESKPKIMGTVMNRLEKAVDPETTRSLLNDSLRYLEDDWFLDAKRKYEAAGSIDAYLARKREDFLGELETHRDEGTLFFSQPIDNAVIDYVRRHPEVEGGVRDATVIYEAKIPHQAIKFLASTDPAEKAHHYCHCPWVKASLREGPSEIPPCFCTCSAGFHKKPYEVIFGRPLKAEVLETVLAGDPWCRFAIHIPEDVVQKA